MTIFYFTIILVVLLALFALGWLLYQRSIRIRNRLQMNSVFTNISHELLTPLTVISASIERLREQSPSNGTDYTLMELNVERMTRLLQLILETAKSQSGELHLLVSQGDVMAFIYQTALCIEPLMHKRGLTFNINCSPQSMMGWIDTDKVDKIIYNLLSNAAKYTHKGGEVTLQVNTNKKFDKIIIKVRDTGIGMSSAQMKNMFHRFYDGAYRSMQVSGIGLGLALTRDLVYLHGGNIDCQSEEGKGTTFTVTLPINKEAFTPAQIDNAHAIDSTSPHSPVLDIKSLITQTDVPAPNSLKPLSSDAYHILIVEDNKDLLMLMRTLLSSRYHITTATNGREALEVVQRETLDLIVSDMMMPEMDGNELTKAIKGNPDWSHLPIILITAKTSEDDRKKSMLIGADDYVTKPFRLRDLELRIDNIVENRKRILGERQAPPAQEEPQPPTADEEFLQRANAIVMAHLSDSDFDRDAFASEMGASPSTLYNKLRQLTGLSVTFYIRNIRLKEARRLAESQPNLRVSDLAYRVGFKDPKYFSTCFKNEFGKQPKELLRGT